MSEPVYFPDGYTRQGYIAAVKGLHGALSFTYRPALVEERDQVSQSIRQNPSDKANSHIRGLLSKKLTDWDVAAPLSVDSIRLLHPVVYDKVYLIVTGQVGSDPKPGESEEGREKDYLAELEALGGGRAPGDVQLGADQKNSQAA